MPLNETVPCICRPLIGRLLSPAMSLSGLLLLLSLCARTSIHVAEVSKIKELPWVIFNLRSSPVWLVRSCTNTSYLKRFACMWGERRSEEMRSSWWWRGQDQAFHTSAGLRWFYLSISMQCTCRLFPSTECALAVQKMLPVNVSISFAWDPVTFAQVPYL